MAPKIFLTGGTGYIGGSVLHALVTTHPEYDITVLLRKIPDAFASTYPNVKIVQGDYDSADILSEQASKADIVVHNGDSDHEPSLNALISGQLKRSTPGHLLHLSGTGIVSDWTSPTYLGELNPKVWSDVDSGDLSAIATLPDDALHRNTEKILFSTAAAHAGKMHIAIMCPPDIYGKGTGPGKTSSVFAPMFIADLKSKGNRAFYFKQGANTRSWVHISDLTALYVAVVEAAATNDPGFAGPDAPGYYFAGTQEHAHITVAAAIGAILHKHGVIAEPGPVEVDLDFIDATAKHPLFPKLGRYLYTSNSRTRPRRAEKLFGYEGRAPGLLEVLEEDVLAALGRA